MTRAPWKSPRAPARPARQIARHHLGHWVRPGQHRRPVLAFDGAIGHVGRSRRGLRRGSADGRGLRPFRSGRARAFAVSLLRSFRAARPRGPLHRIAHRSRGGARRFPPGLPRARERTGEGTVGVSLSPLWRARAGRRREGGPPINPLKSSGLTTPRSSSRVGRVLAETLRSIPSRSPRPVFSRHHGRA